MWYYIHMLIITCKVYILRGLKSANNLSAQKTKTNKKLYDELNQWKK